MEIRKLAIENKCNVKDIFLPEPCFLSLKSLSEIRKTNNG
jgi:hypothetical protein